MPALLRGGDAYGLFVKHLCESKRLVATVAVDRQSKLQNRLFHLFVKHCKAWQPMTLTGDQQQAGAGATTISAISALLGYIEDGVPGDGDGDGSSEMSDKDASTSAADGGKLHWRYQLCALAWLARLLSSGSVAVCASATGSAGGAGLVSAADQTRVWQAFRSARVSYGIQATLAFQLILFLLENRDCHSYLSPPIFYLP